MMCLDECITDDTNVFLVGTAYRRKEKKRLEKQIFRKSFNHAEIIGEELCGIRNLSCPHYFLTGDILNRNNKTVSYKIAKKTGASITLGSFDFRREGEVYFSLDKFSPKDGKSVFEQLLSLAPSIKNREELIREICELFALDVYMGQVDRFSGNVLFSYNTNNGEIHLASIFDFQYSLKRGYISDKSIYDNQIHSFKDISDFCDFIHIYPKFREMLKNYLDVDLVKVALNGYKKRKMIIPSDKLHFYSEFDDSRKELIKRITD